jgi:hypothetical protein
MDIQYITILNLHLRQLWILGSPTLISLGSFARPNFTLFSITPARKWFVRKIGGLVPWGSEVFWCQRFRRRRGGENLWARPVEFHFYDEGCSPVRIQTHSTKTYSPDQFCCVCQCYIVVFGRGKCNIFSGKISNELVQITDDNRQIRLF